MTAEIARLFPDAAPHGRDADGRALVEALRIVEALLFAAPEPIGEPELARHLPNNVSLATVMARLRADYAGRGIHLARVGARWAFRTADDLGWLLSASARKTTRLSRAAMETLAIVAYHQPATRADIEAIRGVGVSKGTLDVLLATGWVRPRGRRRSPGRPTTYGTTDIFLLHFGLETIGDLPTLDELHGAGLFDERLALSTSGSLPSDDAAIDDDPLLDQDAAEDEPLLDKDAERAIPQRGGGA